MRMAISGLKVSSIPSRRVPAQLRCFWLSMPAGPGSRPAFRSSNFKRRDAGPTYLRGYLLRLDLRVLDRLGPFGGFGLAALRQRLGRARVHRETDRRELLLDILVLGRGVHGGIELADDFVRRARRREHGEVG